MAKLEKILERSLFESRWLLAPCYCGLVISLAALVVIFFKELMHIILTLLVSDPTQIILGCLSLIDLSLTGNLLLTVIFSGYENFVSKFDIEHQDHINWKVSVDSSTLKLKLMSSIVAISGVHLLKIFMSKDPLNIEEFKWMIIAHIVFVFSGVLLAAVDYISGKAKLLKH